MRADGATGVGGVETIGAVEVVVVGAGPAGAITALLLARLGVDVLLLDRAGFPRPKPCGDCLSAAATDFLRRVGLLDRVRAAGAVELDRWDVVALDGTTATGRFGDATALSLERRRLDGALLDAAREAGAAFRQAHVTDLVRDGRVAGVRCRDADGTEARIGARLVVGADGLRSVVARRLDRVRRAPKLRKVSLTAHLPAPERGLRHGEMHLVPHGCLGYAPAGDRLCNLTLVVESRAADDLGGLGPASFFRRRVRQRIRQIEDRAPASALADRDGRIRAALDALTNDDLMASGPFDFPGRAPIAAGAALVGDAAGYYDPFTGQGIYHAMAAAERLAQAVGPALTAADRIDERRGPPDRDLDRALRDYARAKRRLTRPAHRVQAGVEWVLSRPALGSRVVARLAAAPAAMDRLIEVTGDLKSPASLLSPAVVSSFIVPPSRRFD